MLLGFYSVFHRISLETQRLLTLRFLVQTLQGGFQLADQSVSYSYLLKL